MSGALKPLSAPTRCELCGPGTYADGVFVVNCLPCKVRSPALPPSAITSHTIPLPSDRRVHERVGHGRVYGLPTALHDYS